MEDFKGLKEAVYGAENIIILTQRNPGQDAVGAALALFSSLKNIGKKVNLPTVSAIPSELSLPSRKAGQKTFLVSLKKDVAEIYYEKKDGEVNLYLKPKKDDIKIQDLSFKTIESHSLEGFPLPDFSQKPDLLIALGINDFQQIEKEMESLSIPSQIKIINVDNNALNQKYADLNLVKDFPSLSQACAYLIKDLDPKAADKSVADSLLYGAAPSLKTAGNNEKAAPFLAWAAKKGADLEFLGGNGEEKPAIKKLLGATLKNLKLLSGGICCSTITGEDFRLAGSSPKDLSAVAGIFKTVLKFPSFLIIWEDGPQTASGIFYSSDKNSLGKICRKFSNSQSKGNGILFKSNADAAKTQEEVVDAINK